MGVFRRKKEASYVDLHNSAVIRYRRACRTFIWAGVVNFVGLLIGVVQHYTIEANFDQPIPFYFCFGTSELLFSWFESFNMHIALFWVLVAIITLALTSGAVLLGVFSSTGKKKVLIAMVAAYGADWILLLVKNLLFFERDGILGLLIGVGIHVIISFFVILAVYQFYNVINIEKRFKDIPTVAEVKAREEQEKLESEEKENEHKS
ncbi:MAG: hypothetical protein J5511_01025 [Bacilli bacterium]|nr:hypothetical protein [Bacilli bacterium]